MDLNDIPLFAMLKGQMGYQSTRQRVIAENVANADTPGFAPRDLAPFRIPGAAGGPGVLAPVAMAGTQPMHLSGRAPVAAGFKPVEAPDSEARLDGNQVVLEEQMMKMTQARMDYETAVSLYQKSLSMLRTAARKPGA